MHPLVKTGQKVVSGVYKGNLLGWVYVCYIGGELCETVREAHNNWLVGCTHGHQEHHHRRQAPKLHPLFCGGLSAATVVTLFWYRHARRPTRGIPAMHSASGISDELRRLCAMGGTYSRADGSTRRPDVYRGREVGTQCVDEVVKVHV